PDRGRIPGRVQRARPDCHSTSGPGRGSRAVRKSRPARSRPGGSSVEPGTDLQNGRRPRARQNMLRSLSRQGVTRAVWGGDSEGQGGTGRPAVVGIGNSGRGGSCDRLKVMDAEVRKEYDEIRAILRAIAERQAAADVRMD